MSGEGLISDPRPVHGSAGHVRLKELMHRGTEFLGCEVAILGGAMSWVSERNLVAAISNAGGFGVIACGAMTPALLDTEIAETKARTDKPFGVNLITMHPQLSELIDVCATECIAHPNFKKAFLSASARDAVAIRFQALMVATASVRSASSFSLKCGFTSPYTESGTCVSDTFVSDSAHSSAAFSGSVK